MLSMGNDNIDVDTEAISKAKSLLNEFGPQYPQNFSLYVLYMELNEELMTTYFNMFEPNPFL